ncbi:MAG TPA: BlaI/MecI/CopY family transcriptional regulator [Candidatus Acidoferrum sp.]|nr:BlaI/MecI/CopY family transcriptional regulator [Candidatus Acidoferrum sp.]
MSKPQQPLLTDTELELMLILWKLGESSVHDVLQVLPAKRAMAYTSASTIIRILEKKGFVASRKQGKAHLYYPLLAKTEYEARTLGHVVGRLFDNTPAALVARLIDHHKLSPDEIKELKKLLNKKE